MTNIFDSNIINDVQQTNKIVAIKKNNETIVQAVFYGNNRNSEITEWHKKVMSKWGQPINYVYFPFEQGYNHAHAIDWFIELTKNIADYWMFFDNDAIPLRKDYIDIYYSKAADKETLVGCAGQSNHLIKQNGEYNHPYAFTCGMFLSKELHSKLGNPSFQPNHESDTGEALTWAAERQGYGVSLFWPKSTGELTDDECRKHIIELKHKKSAVGQHWFGFATTFGQDLFYHQFCAPVERSKGLFISKCKEVLEKNRNTELDVIVVSINCSDYLELTLSENVKHFDNYYVATIETDIETIELCKKYGATYIICEDPHNKNGFAFDKGSCIKTVFQKLKNRNRWILLLDADIILPSDFRDILQLNNLDTDVLYGTSRCFAWDYSQYLEYKNGKNINEFDKISGGHGCGYFMLFNLDSYKIRNIPLSEIYTNGNVETDMALLEKFHPKRLDVGKLSFNVLHLGGFSLFHDGRIDKGKFDCVKNKKFKEMPNLKELLWDSVLQ